MNSYLVLPLVQAVFSLILLIMVLRAKSQDTARNLFAMYLGELLLWGVAIFLMRSSSSLDQAYFWEKLILPLGLLMPVTIYHFSLAFGGFKIKKWIIFGGYLSVIIALILSQAGWVVAGMQLKPYGYAPVPGPLFTVIAGGSFIISLMATINLWKYSKTAIFSEERTRSTYILVGMIISMVGGAFDVLPLLGLALYPGVIFGNIVFCFLTSIAVLKYHLMGVNIIVRKGTTYFLISAIAAVPYISVLFVFERLIKIDVPIWAWAILFILVAFALQPIWRVVQSLVDKLFYMSRYDFLKALDDFSRKTHRINDINALGKSLVMLIQQALQSSVVYLFLPSASGDFTMVSTSKENAAVSAFSSRNPILSWLRSNKRPLRREEIEYISRLQLLTTEEMNELNAVRADLSIPVLNKEDNLVGILILGPKLNSQRYSDEDERLIFSVTSRLALELENARLFSQETMMRKELQKQNELKTEFLNSAAHELKTPLTAIISSSEMLIEKLSLTGEELDQRLINNVHASSLAMNRRVSELLIFARTQIGTMAINKQNLDINNVIQDTASRLSPLFISRGQNLSVEVQPVDTIQADKDKLEQVLVNLLSNANKYSPNDSSIAVRSRQNDGTVIVEVEDSAPIIPEIDKSKLFKPYYRGEDPKIRQRIPGLGLGLAITKTIIDLHGGKIWIASNSGKGNVFVFSLAALS